MCDLCVCDVSRVLQCCSVMCVVLCVVLRMIYRVCSSVMKWCFERTSLFKKTGYEFAILTQNLCIHDLPRVVQRFAACCSVLQRVALDSGSNCCESRKCRWMRMLAYVALQCIQVSCSVLQCVAECCSELQCVAVCCSVLQSVAMSCIVLQCFAVCCRVFQCIEECCSVLQCIKVCSSVQQCGAVCCSVLQCVAVCCTVVQCI